MTMGDFNSCHHSWGSLKNNRADIVIFKYFTETNILILSERTPIYILSQNALTHIDLSISTPNQLPK